jgi:molybdenum cofactor synthesis domain-containing protein
MQNPHAPANRDRTVEIFSIGNELLVGQVLDTNTHWLIKSITGLGAHVRRTTMIRDEYEEIGIELQSAVLRRPRLIITTGGLGPTDDDLTLRAIAASFGRPLREDPQAYEWVAQRYAYIATQRLGFDATMTPSRAKMAQFPEGSRPIYNPSGAAPAMALDVAEGVTLVSLPGVPSEMKDIYTQSLQPVLEETVGAGGYVERSLVLQQGDESRLAPALIEVQSANPAVYVKSRGQTFEDGRYLTVVLSHGGRNLEQVRAAVQVSELLAIERVTAFGYVVLRVVGDDLQ